MRISVRLYGPLRVVVGSDVVELALSGESATVAQALADLVARYPQTSRYLRDTAGGVPPGVRALLAESRLDGAHALATPLRDGDRLTLLMPIVGG
jgi:molybdopterin converting factor small subunit